MSDTDVLPKSEPVRRLEVFTGAGRRRRWTAEQKERIVAETYASEASVCAVARRHGLTPQQLFGWRRDVRQRMAASGTKHGLAFASVVVEALSSCLSAARSAAGSGISTIEIIIGAMTVRVPPGADVASLQTVLQALKAVS
jgi:transposase